MKFFNVQYFCIIYFTKKNCYRYSISIWNVQFICDQLFMQWAWTFEHSDLTYLLQATPISKSYLPPWTHFSYQNLLIDFINEYQMEQCDRHIRSECDVQSSRLNGHVFQALQCLWGYLSTFEVSWIDYYVNMAYAQKKILWCIIYKTIFRKDLGISFWNTLASNIYGQARVMYKWIAAKK